MAGYTLLYSFYRYCDGYVYCVVADRRGAVPASEQSPGGRVVHPVYPRAVGHRRVRVVRGEGLLAALVNDYSSWFLPPVGWLRKLKNDEIGS